MNRLARLALPVAALLVPACPAAAATEAMPTERQVLDSYAEHLHGARSPFSCQACSDEKAASLFSDALGFRLTSIRCLPLGASRASCRFIVTTGSGVAKPDNCTMIFERREAADTAASRWRPQERKPGLGTPNVRCE